MNKIYGILCIMLCLFCGGCDDDSNHDAEIGLNITERNVSFTSVGGSVIVTLSMEGSKATSNKDWCVPSVSGKVVTVSLQANPDLEARTAMVTITKGKETISFPVTQPGNLIPVPQIKNLRFDAKGGSQAIHIDCALPVTVVPDVSWLSAEMDGNTLILHTLLNNSADELSTVVKLTSGNLESEIAVSQAGITLEPEKADVVMYNTGDEVTVKVNSTLAFTAVSDKEWLTVTQGDDFITLVATDNNGQPAREATVTLTSGTLTVDIAVTQRIPIYADYLGNWIMTGDNNGTKFTCNVSLVQATANSTYKMTGWGASILATDSKYALLVQFNAATGQISLATQDPIGVYTDSGTSYDVSFYGQIFINGGLSRVTGSYTCYGGMLQRNGSVTWVNSSVTLSGGVVYDIIGAKYFLKNKVTSGVVSFNADFNYMKDVTMERKTKSAVSVRSAVNNEKTKSFSTIPFCAW